MAPMVLNRPRELAWHSGKASPSARDLALGEGRFLVRSVPGSYPPSVALRKVSVSRSDFTYVCIPIYHLEYVNIPKIRFVKVITMKKFECNL
jgi:hypothetical protein